MNFTNKNLDTACLRKGNFGKTLAGLGASFSAAVIISFGNLSSSHAAPVIDTFENLDQVKPALNSSILSNGSGTLTVLSNETSPGVWGAYGKAIVDWSTNGYLSYGFSLNPTDEQYVFQFTGAQAIGDTQLIDVAFYLYVDGSPLRINNNDAIIQTGPIVPIDGAWSFNVYEAAIAAFGAVNIPSNTLWSAQIYSSPAASGLGYSFESFQATTAVPEPHIVLLFGIAGSFLLMKRIQRRSIA